MFEAPKRRLRGGMIPRMPKTTASLLLATSSAVPAACVARSSFAVGPVAIILHAQGVARPLPATVERRNYWLCCTAGLWSADSRSIQSFGMRYLPSPC